MESISQSSREIRKQFEEVICEHRPALWSYCLKLTRSPWDADDLAQETILKCFAQMSYLYQAVNPKAYLFRMATNKWIDRCRREKKIGVMDDESLAATAVHTTMDTVDLRDSMETLIDTLPPRQRIVVLLIDVFHFKAGEVAEMIAMTEGGVKAILYRARQTLKNNSHPKNKNSGDDSMEGIVKRKPIHNDLLDAYLKAFNDRDPDAIVALLDEHATMDIIGVTQEYGKQTIRKYSLADWAASPDKMRGEYAMIDDELAVLVYIKRDNDIEALNTIIRLEQAENKICYLRDYFFSPELIQYVAEQLNVPYHLNGYFWDGKYYS